MVRDGCGDCANRVPVRRETQATKQTKRAIIETSVEAVDYGSCCPGSREARLWLASTPNQAPRGGNVGDCYSCVTGVVFVTPPYFDNHFSSSRTLILPCQGFFASSCPSPGKISNSPGTFSSCRARSSRYASSAASRTSSAPATMWVGVRTLLNW